MFDFDELAINEYENLTLNRYKNIETYVRPVPNSTEPFTNRLHPPTYKLQESTKGALELSELSKRFSKKNGTQQIRDLCSTLKRLP